MNAESLSIFANQTRGANCSERCIPPMKCKLLMIATACLLSACGGGDDSAVPAVIATADALTLGIGQSAQLLSNDLIGGNAARVGTGGNVTFAVTSEPLPTGVTVADGVVAVGATAVPGVINVGYRLCDAANSTNCATATAVVTVPTPPIVAVADTFNLTAGNSGDVLANDTLGGSPANAQRVTVSAVAALPAGITLSSAGLVAVAIGLAPASYPIGYRACDRVTTTNCATATATVTVVVPALGAVSGRVIDSATAAGIAGVNVTAGGVNGVTDSAGAYSLTGVAPGERVALIFAAANYAGTTRIARVTSSSTVDVQARLVRVSASIDVPVDTGGTVVATGAAAQLVLPAASVQRSDGTLPTGSLRVRLTPINPAIDSSLMPGDFTTLVSGAPTLIESFGALGVDVADSSGAAVRLRSGQTATIRIPFASRSAAAPASVPMFYFDNASGRWIQEGTATLAGTGTGRYYQGTIARFGIWNAGQAMPTVRVTGCLVDGNGARVAGARVNAEGVDYSSTSTATSDTNGNFMIPLRQNGVATMIGAGNGLLSNTLRLGPFAVDNQVTNCLGLGQAGAGVTMKLTWGISPSDLDSYLYTPSGSRIYFANRGALLTAPFANLDVDAMTSFGPEVVTLTKLMVGSYKYAVNNFSGQASGRFSASSARVELSLPGRTVELFTPPSTGETLATEWWQLFELDVDARCNVTVRRTGTLSASPPTAPATAAPTYCTP